MAVSHAAKLTPLAFALAMSFSASSADVLREMSTTNFFQPGRLRDSLDPLAETSLNITEGQHQTEPSRIAQWFNFCWTGMWRRC
jgi:hypothetical protein